MSDLPIPPYFYTYLPFVAAVLVVLGFVAISLPLASKPIAGTTLRRQSIVAVLAAAIAMFEGGLAGWELLLILFVGGAFVAVYYRNHLGRKRIAEAVAADKAAARKAQLDAFLKEVESDSV